VRVLCFVEYYLPGYKSGGPVRSVSNMVEALGDEIEFRIVARDRDEGDTSPYAGVPVDVWHTMGKAAVLHLSPQRVSLGSLRAIIASRDFDVLYLNSLFSPGFTLRTLLLRRLGAVRHFPVVLAPRGQLLPNALRLKAAKKRAFLAATKLVGLYRDIVWQATTAAEVGDIARTFPNARVEVAPNLPMDLAGLGMLPQRPPKQSGKLRCVFLSRISPKKNLEGALRMLRGVRGEVTFDVCGPLQDTRYWQRCREMAAELPEDIAFRYLGERDHLQVLETLSAYDLFLLPTLSENFGHVILEALVAGCPVLISDQTPWRDLEAQGVGWDLSLDEPGAFTRALQSCVDMDEQAHRRLADRVAQYGRQFARHQHQEAAALTRELFRSAAADPHR